MAYDCAAHAAQRMTEAQIAPIEQVVDGTHPRRTNADEITLFDEADVGLQELAGASVAERLAVEAGKATLVAL